MDKTVFFLLIGDKESSQADQYQLLQEEEARAEGRRGAIDIEVAFAPAFDQLRVLRKRLLDSAKKPVDAVVVEPASVAAIDLLLRDLKGKTGVVLLNAWAPSIEESAKAWGNDLPFGTVSTDHTRIGEIQGRQISALVPAGGNCLCLTGPQRSSAAQQRLAGARSTLRPGIRLLDTEAGEWTEAAGISSFNSWYGVFKARNDVIHVVAGQSDELALGAIAASKAVQNPSHREMFSKARFLGVDACPGLGKRLVDTGVLAASIVTPATSGPAIASLVAFWKQRKRLPLRAFTEGRPYPSTSAPPA
jgi:ABC-type sugar transport system substrate-binding protein